MAINHNSDFLFLFEAALNNPNGDPDQENKPRMDYDTDTNLCTDVRVKRTIRDYLKANGQEIFVDGEDEKKVTMDEKLKSVLSRLWNEDEEMKKIIDNEVLFKAYLDIKGKKPEDMLGKIVSDKPANNELNLCLLKGLVNKKFVDIRMFGSAFAVKGFQKSITGAIQLNWGYSLNKVYLIESDTIAGTMGEKGNSTFGKDYRVKYSLLAFHGTINRAAAQTTGLTDSDVVQFREAIWQSVSANPTRSKLNQYGKMYLEIVYNDGFSNGQFGDLRNLVKATPLEAGKDREVKNIGDLNVDFSALRAVLTSNTGKDKPIKEVILKVAPDLEKQYNPKS
jgi:CRISPR-associated protein Csh2